MAFMMQIKFENHRIRRTETITRPTTCIAFHYHKFEISHSFDENYFELRYSVIKYRNFKIMVSASIS